ncbi:ribonuclease J [Candidatus Woesearchaeota archaeon]|nr:MAG: ribonuclease J [Candidatus Woesearchaeota archaeon]
MLEVVPIGGYGEVGRNCTAVKHGDDIILLDMGYHVPRYIECTEEEGETLRKVTFKALREAEAIPDDRILGDLRHDVKAIVLSHAHLDHIGAVPYLANRYRCPIVATPYCCAVLERILRDEKIKLHNQIVRLNVNSAIKLGGMKIEFINTVHSTPQTAMIAVHTADGVILYTNDFKFDNFPTLGKRTNYDALRRLKGKIKVLIGDALYAGTEQKTPSESVVREMLKDLEFDVAEKRGIVATTFSSHIARLKSLMKFGFDLGRRVVFLGRSLFRYCVAAQEIGLVDFREVKIVRYADKIKKEIKRIGKKKEKYFLVVTGNQGEPKSVLRRMAEDKLKYGFSDEDCIIFSCRTIPTELNRKQRKELENELKLKGIQYFKDVHVSGHGAKEDLRELLTMTVPELVLPSHADKENSKALSELCDEVGIKSRIVQNGEWIKI